MAVHVGEVQALRRLLASEPDAMLDVAGSFALVAREGECVRLARSLEIFRTKLIERLRLEQEYKELNEHLEEQVEARTQDLQETAERLQEVNRRLEEAHRQLTESVQYASRIQRSMLPSTANSDQIKRVKFDLYVSEMKLDGPGALGLD